MGDEALLRFAVASDDAAAGLVRFRENLPHQTAARITAIISELFAISAALRQIHNHAGSSAAFLDRIANDRHHGLLVLFHTLNITLADLFDMFATSRARPMEMAWEELNYRMDRDDGCPLLDRLECYRDFLDAQQAGANTGEMAGELRSLLTAQQHAQQRRRRRSSLRLSFSSLGPAIPRFTTPVVVSPTALSDDTSSNGWDNYPGLDRSPVPAFAPEPPLSPLSPLSPTFTSSLSSQATMSSTQTSYSGDPYFPAVSRSLPPHWAQQVYDGSYPATQYTPTVPLGYRSTCHGDPDPAALHNLVQDGFIPAIQYISFDDDRLCVRFYFRPEDHRARILIVTKDTHGRPVHFCVPLNNLKAIRHASTLKLCRFRRRDRSFDLWARLTFLFHERMVLFYSTFVAMKRQDECAVAHRYLVEHFELSPPSDPSFAEQELFAGQMRDGNMYHALRLFRDPASGVVRLEASALRGPRKDVPIWTAFVTKYSTDPDWAEFQQRGLVSFAAIRPPPKVFVAGYEVPKNRAGEYCLPFTSDEDAAMFIESWTGLCRSQR